MRETIIYLQSYLLHPNTITKECLYMIELITKDNNWYNTNLATIKWCMMCSCLHPFPIPFLSFNVMFPFECKQLFFIFICSGLFKGNKRFVRKSLLLQVFNKISFSRDEIFFFHANTDILFFLILSETLSIFVDNFKCMFLCHS